MFLYGLGDTFKLKTLQNKINILFLQYEPLRLISYFLLVHNFKIKLSFKNQCLHNIALKIYKSYSSTCRLLRTLQKRIFNHAVFLTIV